MTEANIESCAAARTASRERALARLDDICPIEKLLTPENAKDALRMTNMGWVSLFRQSPAMSMEAEILMGKMVASAIREGHWVDIPVQGAHEELERADLAEVTTDNEGTQVLRPNERFVSFVRERLAPFGPREVSRKH